MAPNKTPCVATGPWASSKVTVRSSTSRISSRSAAASCTSLFQRGTSTWSVTASPSNGRLKTGHPTPARTPRFQVPGRGPRHPSGREPRRCAKRGSDDSNGGLSQPRQMLVRCHSKYAAVVVLKAEQPLPPRSFSRRSVAGLPSIVLTAIRPLPSTVRYPVS